MTKRKKCKVVSKAVFGSILVGCVPLAIPAVCSTVSTLQVNAQPVGTSNILDGYTISLFNSRLTSSQNYYAGYVVTRQRENGIYVVRSFYDIAANEQVDGVCAFATRYDPSNDEFTLWCVPSGTSLSDVNTLWHGTIWALQYEPIAMKILGDFPANWFDGYRLIPSNPDELVMPAALGSQKISIDGFYATNNDWVYGDGYDKGYQDGTNDGYESGYTDGYNNGYDTGSAKGIEDTGFLALFNAILSAPVSIIGGALDFELFGVNFKSLVFVLLTIAIVVFVIGIFKSRKE